MEEKELTKWQKIKKAWKEPKTHALMSLGLYAIFFTSIFLVVKIRGIILDAKYDKPNIEYEKVEVIDEYKELDNYEYKYTITKNNDTYVLNGTVYKNKEKLKEEGNNKIYYLNDESEIYPQEYIDLENKLGINLTYLNPEYIYNYIKISKLIDSTEYKDSTKKEIYEISIKDLKELFKINDRIIFIVIQRNRCCIITCIYSKIITHFSSFSRTYLPRIPLINDASSCVANFFASSTASLIETPVGTDGT